MDDVESLAAQSTLAWLERFYARNCDGDWEHEFGVKIETLDNPGWSVSIDLVRTTLECKHFERREIERSEEDWIHCSVEKAIWKAFGGAHNLIEILEIFREWAESAN